VERFTRPYRTSPTLRRLTSSSTDLWRISEVDLRAQGAAC
jgi:hypothetical protein